jgi:hypothetical protein
MAKSKNAPTKAQLQSANQDLQDKLDTQAAQLAQLQGNSFVFITLAC